MTSLKWNRPSDQTYQAGLDRGVLYLQSGEAVAWSGLISVEDSGETTTTVRHIDGQKYLSTVSARDWKGALEAYTFPEEFDALIGIAEVGDGFYADSQMPDRFGLSYRTIVSAPDYEERQHYKMHLIYDVIASISEFTHSTLTADGVEPIPFKFDLSAIPQLVPDHRPTAHFIIDTRKISDVVRGTIEGILYGNGAINASMPTITELIDLLFYGDTVTITPEEFAPIPAPALPGQIFVPPREAGPSQLKTWKAVGSNKNVHFADRFDEAKGVQFPQGTFFELHNVDFTWIDQEKGIYKIGSTPSLGMRLMSDTDGTPYYEDGGGSSNVGIDTDTTPYYEQGKDEATLATDTDGVPFFEPNQ